MGHVNKKAFNCPELPQMSCFQSLIMYNKNTKESKAKAIQLYVHFINNKDICLR